ncbi:hypothetical protein HYALB_00006391 [Hymenoscyphus albidus]|uniref:Hydrophobin n=1 Tax=Hymenoscyphus albidus TaxID=595503 RepID=A0A9N9LIL6_9HELO|nr:hypothetical protein HYALB_00006391 [Hymenoscyphus albidus]
MQITAILLAIGLLATPTVQQTALVYCEYNGCPLPDGSQGCNKHVFCCNANLSANDKGPWQVGRECNRVTNKNSEPFSCNAQVSESGQKPVAGILAAVGSVMCC